MRGAKALEYLATSPWAIRPDLLEVGRSIILGETSPDMVSTREQRPMDGTRMVSVRNGVATIDIVGPIYRYADWMTEMCGGVTVETLAKDLQTALDNQAIRAIILHIDSPGGEAKGIGELAAQIRAGTERKPIVAYVGGEAASAGYYLASAASEIVLSASGIVGSIGVALAYPRKKDDPKSVEFVSSISPMKRPDVSTEAGREEVQRTVDSIASVFVNDVAKYRAVSPHKVTEDFGRGGLKVGAEAVESGMADRVGTYEGVLADLASGYMPKVPARNATSEGPGKPTSRPATASSASVYTKPRGANMAKPSWLTKFLGGGLSAAAEAGEPIDFEAIARMERAAVNPEAASVAVARPVEPTATLEARTFDIEADPRFKAMKAQVEAANAAAKIAAENDAATFVASLVKSDRLLPAQEADAKSLFVQLAADDRVSPLASGVSRVAVARKLLDSNPKHGLTTEVVSGEDGRPVLPPGHKVLPHQGDKPAPTQADIDRLIAMTDTGAAILAKRTAK